MKQEELRVGNWVYYESTIDDHEPWKVTGSDIAMFEELHERYAGIPIDEKWLKKLDFEIVYRENETSNYDIIAKKGSLKVKFLNGNISTLLSVGGTTILLEHINEVHKLQNFYYWHYNTELEVIENVQA